MKKLVEKTAALLFGAKVHATHIDIKGRKSGGQRDNNGKDWKNSSSFPNPQEGPES